MYLDTMINSEASRSLGMRIGLEETLSTGKLAESHSDNVRYPDRCVLVVHMGKNFVHR